MELRLVSPRAFRWSDEQIAQILLEDLDKGPAFGEYGIVRLVLSILWISRRLDGEIRSSCKHLRRQDTYVVRRVIRRQKKA